VETTGYLPAKIAWQDSYWTQQVELLNRCKGTKAHALMVKMIKLIR